MLALISTASMNPMAMVGITPRSTKSRLTPSDAHAAGSVASFTKFVRPMNVGVSKKFHSKKLRPTPTMVGTMMKTMKRMSAGKSRSQADAASALRKGDFLRRGDRGCRRSAPAPLLVSRTVNALLLQQFVEFVLRCRVCLLDRHALQHHLLQRRL